MSEKSRSQPVSNTLSLDVYDRRRDSTYMSQLSKSLEKRIQELTASIETQKAELTAYERVLHMEVVKDNAPAETSDAPEPPLPASSQTATKKKRVTKKAASKPAEANADRAAGETRAETPAALSGVSFTGNKTTLVAEIVKSYGDAGASPKDVDAFFTARNVERSKNLIYNTLSYLVAQKKLQRHDGRYFSVGVKARPVAAKKTAAATKKAPTKRRLSPEGLKRIKEALKKRWAAKRAADGAATKKK